MGMTKVSFNTYLDALHTVCQAYNITPITTIDRDNTITVKLVGAELLKRSQCYIDVWDEPQYPYMAFDLDKISASVYGLIARDRSYFKDTLNLATTEDIDKLWEELLMKNFTKDDLRNGDFVIRRDGVKGVVIVDTGSIVCQNGNYVCFSSYNTNLVCINGSTPLQDLDIMKVYRGSKSFTCCDSLGVLMYDRESVEVEEMTLEQVCKALGKNIKIVKG